MKSTLTLTLLNLFLIVFSSQGQYGECDSDSKRTERIKSTKTLVVLTGDEKFDDNLKAGLKRYWKITEYEIIEKSEVDSKLSSEKYSFILPLKKTITVDNRSQTYPVYGVMVGGKNAVSDHSANSLIAYNPISKFGSESTVTDAAYRAKNMIKLLHDYILIKLEGEIDNECGPKLIISAERYYNRKKSLVRKKTLLINKAQLESVKEKHLRKHYQGPIEIVSREEIENKINNEATGYNLLLPVFARHKYIFVIDLETGSIIYNDYQIFGQKLKRSDIKELSESAGY